MVRRKQLTGLASEGQFLKTQKVQREGNKIDKPGSTEVKNFPSTEAIESEEASHSLGEDVGNASPTRDSHPDPTTQ